MALQIACSNQKTPNAYRAQEIVVPPSEDSTKDPLNDCIDSNISAPPERATCCERWFSPMGPGSLRGSVFTLMASGIGAGVLTLPYVCKINGFGVGLIMLTLGMIGTIWSCRTLAECAIAAKSKKYLQTCQILGGKKLAILYQLTIVSLQYGAILGFQIISIWQILFA